jgi:hypothetical protein
MEVSGQLPAPTDLPLGREPRYQLNRRLGGPHSRSALLEKRKGIASLRRDLVGYEQ